MSLAVESREESIAVPNGMYDCRVYKSSEEEGVAKVCRHLASFSHGSGNNGSSSSSKSKLEEEADVIIIIVQEVKVSRFSIKLSIITVSEGVSNSEETNSSSTSCKRKKDSKKLSDGENFMVTLNFSKILPELFHPVIAVPISNTTHNQ